jgi:hypothetical protein
MFQKNFRPYPPSNLDKFLRELSSDKLSLHPESQELRNAPRGYAEINQMYHKALFDRRGASVRLDFNPKDSIDREVLKGVEREFSQELFTLAQRYEIPRHGFSISIQDRSVITGKGASEYYLRVEVLDGNLRPTILTDGCVQSFHKAPVAFMVCWDKRSRESFARPMLTATAFNEAMEHLRASPLSTLIQFPTPNYAFLSICNAMQKYIDDHDRGNTFDFPLDDRQYAGQYLCSARQYEGIAKDILSLEVTGGHYAPHVAVTSLMDGVPTRFDIQVKRHFDFGWVAARVKQVTPIVT